MSSLNLSMELTLCEPFGLCDYDGDELYTTSKVNRRSLVAVYTPVMAVQLMGAIKYFFQKAK